jgi:hypothetical protein
MSLPRPGDQWKLTVNANYQEVMKTLMNLVTVSLFLPILFIRTFLGLPETKPLQDKLQWSAYLAWVFLFASLAFGMLFYWASAKFVKAVAKGREKQIETSFERLRDGAAFSASLLFVLGILALGWFFTHKS